jgi:hypothetical protein
MVNDDRVYPPLTGWRYAAYLLYEFAENRKREQVAQTGPNKELTKPEEKKPSLLRSTDMLGLKKKKNGSNDGN